MRSTLPHDAAAEDCRNLQQEIKAIDYKVNRKSEPTKGRDSLRSMVPEKWELVAIDEIFRLIDYRGKTPKKTTSGKRLITAKNIKRGYLSDEPVEYMSEEAYKKWMVRGYPMPGDIFFVTEGHTMGFAALNDRSDRFALAQRTITLQPICPLNTKFFLYFILSRPFQNLVKLNATGAAAVGMKGSKLRSLPLAFPPNAEQQRIVSVLDAARSGVERLRVVYEQKLAALDALKRSLLHQAFNGQLMRDERVVVAANPLSTFPIEIAGISTTDLHAGILAMSCKSHEVAGKVGEFTHVKAEKIAHMIEARLGIELGRTPVKDAAGPNDFNHLTKVEHRARMAKFFDFKRTSSGKYQVSKLTGFDRHIEKTRAALGSHLEAVEGLLQWMVTMSVQQAEIVATVFAAWNNLLLDGLLLP
uniref:restriction endonuclease subunit S n=1 Tax=Anatilimnocola floriformis TaxID=2948575 RepID=UPI0036F2521F